LIPFGSTWRYDTSAPPTNWFASDFDDTGWSIGNAKFGAGPDPTNVATVLPQRLPVYYFRHTFTVPSVPCEELLLTGTCTDGGYPPDIYLNGTKLVTSGIDIVSDSGNEVGYFDLTPLADLLHAGTNTIAVALNNVWQPTWDDVAFDLDLKAIAAGAVASPSVNILNGSSQIAGGANAGFNPATAPINLSVSAPANTIWRVESADSLSGPWQLVEVVTNTSAGTVLLQDTGQNGRLPPSAVAARFYRLAPN
jgi:hypothetical protein